MSAPIDPAADTTPKMVLRMFADTHRVATAMAMAEPVHDKDKPIKTPAPIKTIRKLCAMASMVNPAT